MGKYIKAVDDLTDRRGNIYIVQHLDTDYLLIHTEEGYLRGGETHDGWQMNALLKGTILWVTPEKEHIYTALSLIRTEAGVPHMMKSLTDSLMLEWRERPLEIPVNYYEPYRILIKKCMEEP